MYIIPVILSSARSQFAHYAVVNLHLERFPGALKFMICLSREDMRSKQQKAFERIKIERL